MLPPRSRGYDTRSAGNGSLSQYKREVAFPLCLEFGDLVLVHYSVDEFLGVYRAEPITTGNGCNSPCNRMEGGAPTMICRSLAPASIIFVSKSLILRAILYPFPTRS